MQTSAQQKISLDHPILEESTWIDVDLTALERNYLAVRALLDRSAEVNGHGRIGMCAAVKKDSYSLGAEQVGHRLAQLGCDMLAVWSADEAEQLAARAVTCDLLILSPIRELRRTDMLYRIAAAGKLNLAAHDQAQLESLNTVARTLGIKLPIHLYVDTGMTRCGFLPDQAAKALASLSQGELSYLKLAGIYTHFASAEDDPEFTQQQYEHLMRVVDGNRSLVSDDVKLHAANSFGLFRDRMFHLNMVRPGLAMYGYAPEMLTPGPIVEDCPAMEAVARWWARLIHVQRVPAGTTVGYGSTYVTDRDSVMGVLPVGYADGYPLALSNQGVTRLFSAEATSPLGEAPVRGRINMDQLVVDLTDIVEARSGGQLAKADLSKLLHLPVELYGREPEAANAIPRLAKLAGSHPYELLCRMAARLPRRYIYR